MDRHEVSRGCVWNEDCLFRRVTKQESIVMTEDSTHQRALVEDVQRQVKVIAEAHGALNARLDPLEVKVDRLESWFDQLEIRIVVLEKSVERLETRAGP